MGKVQTKDFVQQVASGYSAADGTFIPASRAAGFPTAPSGITATASFTPIAGAIGAGDVMGAGMEFVFTYADGAPIPAGSVVFINTTQLSIAAAALVSGEGAYTLQCYNVAQPSAQADNALWDLATGDIGAYLGSIALGTPIDLGASLFVEQSGSTKTLKLTGNSMFARLVTVGGFTVPASPQVRRTVLHGLVL